jgi:hypothetical protein
VRDFPQKVKVENVKLKLSCEISFKKVKLEDVKMKLSCEASFKNEALQVRKMRPETTATLHGRSEHDTATARTCSATVARQTFPIHLPRHVLPGKTQQLVNPLTVKHEFRARPPPKNES